MSQEPATPKALCVNPGHIIVAPDYPDQETAYCLTCAAGGVMGSEEESAAMVEFRAAIDAKPDAGRWDHIPWEAPDAEQPQTPPEAAT